MSHVSHFVKRSVFQYSVNLSHLIAVWGVSAFQGRVRHIPRAHPFFAMDTASCRNPQRSPQRCSYVIKPNLAPSLVHKETNVEPHNVTVCTHMRTSMARRVLEHEVFPGRKELLFMDPAVVSCMMNQCDGETSPLLP